MCYDIISRSSASDKAKLFAENFSLNCEPELSYILAELFNKCLNESCFPEC